MELQDIQTQLQTYRQALDNVQKYRSDWVGAKDLISNTLTSIIKKTGMDAEVNKEEKMEGMELVYLTFGKRESGIFERIGNTQRPFMKEGGYLFYTQIYNGKVSAWITLPVIENFMDRQPPEPIEIYEPAKITEALIIKHVADFLKAMAEWEDRDLQHHEIGYKMRN